MSSLSDRRIVILSDAFSKPSYSPRLRSICEYLMDHGWDVEVYTERLAAVSFKHDYPIYEVEIYRNKRWDWFIKSFWSLFFDWKNWYFLRQVQPYIGDKKYSLVFCTAFATFPLRAAYELSLWKRIPLHIDLRDLVEQAPGYQYLEHRQWWTKPFRYLYKKINIHRRNYVIRRAQLVTSVSPWHVDFIKRMNPDTFLIYNGFDESIFYPRDVSSDCFYICYTGRVYGSSMQDPTLLMEALQTLPIEYKIEVRWYTDSIGKSRIMRMAERFGVSAYMVYNDYVPFTEVCSLLHRSSIVLVLSNKMTDRGPRGIMTTKFYEALGVEKPILCVRSDEGCLAEVINRTHAGLAAVNSEQVKAFIMEKYDEWKEKGFTRQEVDMRNKQQFSRQEEANQFEKFFLRLL